MKMILAAIFLIALPGLHADPEVSATRHPSRKAAPRTIEVEVRRAYPVEQGIPRDGKRTIDRSEMRRASSVLDALRRHPELSVSPY